MNAKKTDIEKFEEMEYIQFCLKFLIDLYSFFGSLKKVFPVFEGFEK